MNLNLHKNIIHKLKKLANSDISNIILFGPNGSGKKTILKFLINNYFKSDVKTKDTLFKLKLNTNTLELNIQSSIYHYEIELNKYTNNRHINILLLYLTKNKDINSNITLIVINNFEYLNLENKKLIKNLMEKKDIRFILITNNISKIDSFLKSFFLLLRIPKCSEYELLNFFSSKKINNNKIKLYINQGKQNIGVISQLIENNSIEDYDEPYTQYSNKLEKLLLKFNINNIKKIRDLLYSFSSKNLCLKNIFNNLINLLLKNKKLNHVKQEILNTFILFNNRISFSFKPIIQYEALIINIYNVIHS